MTVYDVVKKLCGEIEAVGDSSVDEKRFANLETTCEVVDKLLFDINSAAQYADRQEYSMQRIGKYAQHFLHEVAEVQPQADNTSSQKLPQQPVEITYGRR